MSAGPEPVESGFPGGLRAPLAVVGAALALLVAWCMIQLPAAGAGGGASAVAQSQELLVNDLARATADSIGDVAGDLSTASALYTVHPDPTPAGTLAAITRGTPQALGLALVQRSSGTLLAGTGEPVPVESLPNKDLDRITVTLVRDQSGATVVLTAAPLTGTDWLVLVTTGLKIPATTLSGQPAEALLLTTFDGQVVKSRGEFDPQYQPLVTAASTNATGGVGSLVGDAGKGPVVDGARTTPIAVYAPILTGDPARPLGLNLVLVGSAPAQAAARTPVETAWMTAILAAAVLAALMLLGFGFVLPLRRLRAEALGGRRRRSYRLREAAVVSATLRNEIVQVRRGRISARTFVVAAVAPLLVCSAVVGVVAATTVPTAPDLVVQGERGLAEVTAGALRDQLSASLSDLRTFATRATDDVRSLKPALVNLIAQNKRYRSVYVTDADGTVQVDAGRTPLRTVERPPAGSGLHQQNTAGRIPVLYANTPLPDHTHVLIGELDVTKLSSILRRSAGNGKLVDSGLRTLASADGYRAFDPLTDQALKQSVTDALGGVGRPGTDQIDGQWYVVAAATVTGSPSTDPLRWTVVLQQPLTTLPLPDNVVRRYALFAALAVGAAGLLLLGWYHSCFVRPLRRLADAAARVHQGDLKTVIYPERLNEIGTLSQCLDKVRRQRTATPAPVPLLV
ncbi:HAMP domain-containing protein [Kutzneria kofuensis]|nr:HAMP domain-containing protein [Kutzneria kofuensis]